ncbi:MAG: AMP-binding protein [Nocardioidaceae bacterium]
MSRPADLAGLADAAATRWPDATAWVFDETGHALTFLQLRDRARAIADLLSGIDVGQGDRVAVMLDNRAEFPLTWLATAYLGASLVPINTKYRDVDAGHVLDHSGASVVVATPEFAPLLRRIAPAVRLVTTDDDRVVRAVNGDVNAETPAALASAETPANIQYTSGTTGKPKGCVLPHRYWLTLAGGLVDGHPHLGPSDVILTAQPFHYIDPQWNVAAGLASGARLIVLDRFHPTTFWEKVRAYRVTWFYCLGLMPTLLLRMPVHSDDHRHAVRAIHCSAIPPDLHAALEERWRTPWYEAFGMTETGADIRLGPDDHDDTVGTGCLGRVLPYRETRIVGGDGAAVRPGEYGELQLRGEGLMLGYHDDPDATRTAFDGGWFHTGDLVRADDEGRIYYVGRLKDSIRRSGENISAAEVEETLQRHPAVGLAAVVPVSDHLRGEEVRAFVVPEPGHETGRTLADELDAFCRKDLAYFKVPRYWTFRDRLPLTPSERVAKGQLREQELDDDTFEADRRT